MSLSAQQIDSMSVALKSLSRGQLKGAIKSTLYLDLASILPANRPEISFRNVSLSTIPSYLDLATSRGSIQNPMIVMSLEQIRLVASEFIEVPAGDQTRYKKVVLKLMGVNSGKFVLFTNLPREIQNDILALNMPRRLIRANLMHDATTGTDSWAFQGNIRPIKCATSKSICASVIPSIYKPLLPISGRNILISPKWDILILDINHSATLGISSALADNSPLFGIRTLALDVRTFLHRFPWVTITLNVLPKLGHLILQDHVAVTDRGLAGLHSLKFEKKESEYEAIYEYGNSTSFGELAVKEFDENVPDSVGLSGLNVHNRLVQALGEGALVPKVVRVDVFLFLRS